MRNRARTVCRFDYYSTDTLTDIVKQRADALNWNYESIDVLHQIAQRAKQTPRQSLDQFSTDPFEPNPPKPIPSYQDLNTALVTGHALPCTSSKERRSHGPLAGPAGIEPTTTPQKQRLSVSTGFLSGNER